MAQELKAVDAKGRRPVPGTRAPEGWVTTVVPPVPEGKRASSWRRQIRAVTGEKSGADALPGTWLAPGDLVAVPPGALWLITDKAKTGTTRGHRYTTEDATVRIALLDADGTPTTVWGPRHYRNAATALGKTVLNAAAALLGQHPAPEGDPLVLAVAQRPNRRQEPCCRCDRLVRAKTGHLVGRGKEAQVEHWPACPKPGTPEAEALPVPRQRLGCDNCGRSGRNNRASDSSGVEGRVCNRCAREPWYCRSFG